MRRDIDEALQGWPYDPEPGEVVAREVRARDGRTVLQIRVELGLLSWRSRAGPTASGPHGFATYLDYLRHRAAGRGQAPGGKAPPWTMTAEHCAEADREFVQFYHRRVAWLTLQRYDRALLRRRPHAGPDGLRPPARRPTPNTSPRTSGSAAWSCSTGPRPPPPWPWSVASPRRRSTPSARGSTGSSSTSRPGPPTTTATRRPTRP